MSRHRLPKPTKPRRRVESYQDEYGEQRWTDPDDSDLLLADAAFAIGVCCVVACLVVLVFAVGLLARWW